MGSKKKNKSKKSAKDKHPSHGRKCKCAECEEARSKRKWNRRRIEVELAEAQEVKEKKERREAVGFLSGGHQKLKRDLSFEEGYSEPLSQLHSQARAYIKTTIARMLGILDEEKKQNKVLGRTYIYPYYQNAMSRHKLFRAYQMDSDTDAFDAIDGKYDLLWHGTPFRNISSIGHESLHVRGTYCMLGAGIYLAPDFSKAWGFSGWSDYSTVLLCAAKLGKVLDTKDCVRHADDCGKKTSIPPARWPVGVPWGKCSKDCKWVKPQAEVVHKMGYDTASAGRGFHPGARGGSLLHDEYCCYKREQVLPLYALVFTGKET